MNRPLAILLVVLILLIVLTALFAVLAASINEFIAMLPTYNSALTRQISYLQQTLPFLNLHFSSEPILQRLDFDKMMTFTTMFMTHLSGAMVSIGLLVMTVVFMLFEVQHLPYKLRFALVNPHIYIAGLNRALKGVSHYLALKTLISLWTGVIIWFGLLVNRCAVCLNVGRIELSAQIYS